MCTYIPYFAFSLKSSPWTVCSLFRAFVQTASHRLHFTIPEPHTPPVVDSSFRRLAMGSPFNHTLINFYMMLLKVNIDKASCLSCADDISVIVYYRNSNIETVPRVLGIKLHLWKCMAAWENRAYCRKINMVDLVYELIFTFTFTKYHRKICGPPSKLTEIRKVKVVERG